MMEFTLIFLPVVLIVLSSSAECQTTDQPRCPSGTYWDDVVEKCEMCRQLCPYIYVQDIPVECTDSCNPPGPTPVSDTLSAGEIMAIVLMSALVAVALVAIPLLYKSKRNKCKRKLKYPQQETHDEASDDLQLRNDHGLLDV